MTDFIKLKPISELPTEQSPLDGQILFSENDDLKKYPLKDLRDMVSVGVIGSVAPTDATPIVNGGYKPTISGTYDNCGGLVAQPNYDTIFFLKDSVWTKSEVLLPSNVAKTLFDSDNNIEPSTMKATYNASELLVNKAFDKGQYIIITKTIGKDTNYLQTSDASSLNGYIANNLPAEKDGKIKSIKINSNVASDIIFVILENSGNNLIEKSRFTKTIIAGLNTLAVDVDILQNQLLGYVCNSLSKLSFTDGTSGISYISNFSGQNQIFQGYLSYTYDFEYQDYDPNNISYTVDDIIAILNSIDNSGSSNTSISTDDCRITIEGQSNAFGVGALSGLSSSPYSNALYDWSKSFSRIFIWNPKTDQYENLKIGVNNMANWDVDYVYPNSTPSATPTFGPEIGIALMWLSCTKKGRLFIDKNVGDGRPISYFQKGTAYYTEKLARKTKADAWLSTNKIEVKELGFLWVQGESDNTMSSANYNAALSTLITDRITDNFIKDYTNIVLAQVNATNGSYGDGVAQAKLDYCSINKKAQIVTYTDNMNTDNVHLNYTGQINLGVQSMISILKTDNVSYNDLENKSYFTF